MKVDQKERTPYLNVFGLAPLTIYTKPFKCGGKCLFCFTQENVPKSFFENEDTIPAQEVNWDAGKQLELLYEKKNIKRGVGNKIEVIILGGSFTYFPFDYLESFIKSVYDFLNGFVSPTFLEAKQNQKSGLDRCVVLAIETRPDLITAEICEFLLHLGVTKIEFGVQSLDPKVLLLNRRLHDSRQVIISTKLVRDFGFKIGYHIMVGLPGSEIEEDFNMLSKSLWQEQYSPDYLKIYPCIILKGNYGQSAIKKLTKSIWTPLSNESYIELVKRIKPYIPKYVYLNRIQRIAEPEMIEFGPSNIVDRNDFFELCQCIWHRSIIHEENMDTTDYSQFSINIIKQGQGYFVEALSKKGKLLGFLRIGISKELKRSIVREIRVYGAAKLLANKTNLGVQHIGIGKLLMKTAEQIAIENESNTILVNSGIGVKQYFEKLGYQDTGTYLKKKVNEL